MSTVYSALAAVADTAPTHPAIVEATGIRDFGWLVQAADALAAALRRAGVRPAARVALLCPNQAEFAAGFFAVARIGAAVVPLNLALLESEMASVLQDAGISVALAVGPWRARAARALAAATGGAPGTGVVPLEDATGPSPGPGLGPPAGHADAPFLVLYSSGSTGGPKRVERTHRQLLWEHERLAAALAVSGGDRLLGAAPFCHVNGLMRSMVLALLSGATLVSVPEFERRAVGRLIERHAVTGFIGVPFMFATLAETRWPQSVDFSSLRYCFSASAPLRPHVSRRFQERYGIAVRQLYGTTETGTVSLHPGPPIFESPDSVGPPLPGVEVRILDEAGRTLPPGEAGQIAIRSPGAAAGYPDRSAESAAAFRDGYFHPGDTARLDGAGCIYLLGRTSLFINRGGFKVNPLEIEETLEGHPGVREAAVVGETTGLGDERIKAVVVAQQPCTAEDIVAFCRDRMAPFKVPSVVEFRNELPRSAAGKILRRAL